MSKNPLEQPEALYAYIKSVSVQETREQRLLREKTQKLSAAVMQISPDQGCFMAMMVNLISARKIIEIGTFTGYSALAMALAMPDDGQLIACDTSREWVDIGKPFWKQAGVEHKIDVHIAPAISTLNQLIENGNQNHFDLVFIDADKVNYVAYYEKAMQLIRPNGLILVDNVFWGGAVIDSENHDDDTVSIRDLNQLISDDSRVEASMLSIGDGLFLVRKK